MVGRFGHNFSNRLSKKAISFLLVFKINPAVLGGLDHSLNDCRWCLFVYCLLLEKDFPPVSLGYLLMDKGIRFCTLQPLPKLSVHRHSDPWQGLQVRCNWLSFLYLKTSEAPLVSWGFSHLLEDVCVALLEGGIVVPWAWLRGARTISRSHRSSAWVFFYRCNWYYILGW